MKRYEQLAEDITGMIAAGVLRPGDRVPSVRQLHESRGLSASTVFQAYYLLESRGLITSKPRSGYYVKARLERLPPEPEISRPDSNSTQVDVSELVFEVLDTLKAPDIVPLGSAFPCPSLFPLKKLSLCLSSSMRNLDPRHTVVDLPPGNASLRRQIALRYLIDGVHIPTDEIVVTNGALEALNLCLQAVTRSGDTVVLESPTFYAALQALERLGLKAVEVPTHPRDGMDLAALADILARHQPKACWLMTNFQNPLGSTMHGDKKRALVEMLALHQVPLIEDDVYGELYLGSQRPTPSKSFDKQGLVMHCSSFSKCLAPGYRVGWVAAGRFSRDVERLKLMTTLSAAVPSQMALAEYLGQGGYDRHLRQLRQALSVQQNLMMQALTKHFPAGTRFTQPEGGYFLWVALPPGIDALMLHRVALHQGISIAPGPIFSAKREFNNCIRLNYGHPWSQRFEQAIETLGQIARSLAQRQ
ncbi:PLP-dependent aminotransferase family protein [Undibacterium sp.]|uniref:aminotransferase-like domain-containing protein n=1 Tax=Undibacterium sp. TaxID=1914977 RepID=UPI002CC140C2|nr:PLP-dependent aminotransferase family protein [Undibacterium sp.]HTD04204.1 PLP-dependent aminotransferase family protein [Undibacterium sp.]